VRFKLNNRKKVDYFMNKNVDIGSVVGYLS